MLGTSITLPRSVISSVSLFLAHICRFWVSRSGRLGPGKCYLQKGLPCSSQQNLLENQIWWLGN